MTLLDSASLTYVHAALPIEKYDLNMTMEMFREGPYLIYYTEFNLGTVHVPRTHNVTELHRLPLRNTPQLQGHVC